MHFHIGHHHNRGHHHHGHHHHHGGTNLALGMMAGAAMASAMAPPPRPVVQQPMIVQQPAPVVVQQTAPVFIQQPIVPQPVQQQVHAPAPALAPQRMRVQANAAPGSTMQIQSPDGRLYTVVVPDGTQLGQFFECML
mmetsp:Transcript_18068/g.46187  ORF Transcript_18068/g.46187 Transcript_18068/m.46187 type:complete len:137 (+) Transcript_18068:88-498(+)